MPLRHVSCVLLKPDGRRVWRRGSDRRAVEGKVASRWRERGLHELFHNGTAAETAFLSSWDWEAWKAQHHGTGSRAPASQPSPTRGQPDGHPVSSRPRSASSSRSPRALATVTTEAISRYIGLRVAASPGGGLCWLAAENPVAVLGRPSADDSLATPGKKWFPLQVPRSSLKS